MEPQQLPKVQPQTGGMGPVAPQQSAPPQPMPPMDVATPNQPQPMQINPQGDSGIIADDVDLIEKDWVNKAKSIVEQTKDDPHLQLQELNKMRTEYLRKRFNKQIKGS